MTRRQIVITEARAWIYAGIGGGLFTLMLSAGGLGEANAKFQKAALISGAASDLVDDADTSQQTTKIASLAGLKVAVNGCSQIYLNGADLSIRPGTVVGDGKGKPGLPTNDATGKWINGNSPLPPGAVCTTDQVGKVGAGGKVSQVFQIAPIDRSLLGRLATGKATKEEVETIKKFAL